MVENAQPRQAQQMTAFHSMFNEAVTGPTWATIVGVPVLVLDVDVRDTGTELTAPRIARWKWEHTDFDPTWRPNTLPNPTQPGELTSPAAVPAQLAAGHNSVV